MIFLLPRWVKNVHEGILPTVYLSVYAPVGGMTGSVKRNFQQYVFGPVPTWEKPGRERYGYKNEKI